TGASQTKINDPVEAPISSNASEALTSDSTRSDTNVLTAATMLKIDPMFKM
ncbi:hypothetical protein, partial [Staphylococcus aureus]